MILKLNLIVIILKLYCITDKLWLKSMLSVHFIFKLYYTIILLSHEQTQNTLKMFAEGCWSYLEILSWHILLNIDIEDITRWREDMNFMFEWQEQYQNIKFISSSQRVIFFLLYGETNSTKAKGGNRDVIERYDTHKGDIRKIRHSGPGWSGVWNLRVA